MIGERLDGKPAQQVNLADADGESFAGAMLAGFEAAALRARAAEARLVGVEFGPPVVTLPAPVFPPVASQAPVLTPLGDAQPAWEGAPVFPAPAAAAVVVACR